MVTVDACRIYGMSRGVRIIGRFCYGVVVNAGRIAARKKIKKRVSAGKVRGLAGSSGFGGGPWASGMVGVAPRYWISCLM